MTKLYKSIQPYGRITVLDSGKRYHLLSPSPIPSDDWAEKAGMQTWSVVSLFDGFAGEDKDVYSKELKAVLHGSPSTLIINPVNVCIELVSDAKSIMIWTGEEVAVPDQETEVDLSEDDNYLSPDYLVDVAPVMDDGFPV